MPLERVRREVDVEQFDFFLDRGGEAIVHVLGEWRHRGFDGVILRAAPPSRVDAVDVRSLTVERERFLALPERQRTKPCVGGQEVDEMRRAGAGQADDDQRTLDLHIVDLGIALDAGR